jgi:hypothetical protein
MTGNFTWDTCRRHFIVGKFVGTWRMLTWDT